jgi:thioredoxin-related protein
MAVLDCLSLADVLSFEMLFMKALLFSALFVLGIQASCSAQTSSKDAGELTWYTDLAKAQEVSAARKKPIFGFFTGSAWCGWCRKLQADVFAKPAFVEWANKNVVLLELDFPRRKQLPAELAQQNQALQQAFKIQGYPTIWLFYVTEGGAGQGMNLSALGSLGYPQGAVKGQEEVKFLTDANAILANGKK